MLLSDERRIRCDEGDHRRFDIDVENVAGRGIARVAWRDRVVRMISFA